MSLPTTDRRAPRRRLLAALATTGLLIPACSFGDDSDVDEAANSDDKRPPLVRVEAVEQRMVRREIETTGYLESERHVQVTSTVPGRGLEVPVQDSDKVARGQVIVRLDAREAQTSGAGGGDVGLAFVHRGADEHLLRATLADAGAHVVPLSFGAPGLRIEPAAECL